MLKKTELLLAMTVRRCTTLNGRTKLIRHAAMDHYLTLCGVKIDPSWCVIPFGPRPSITCQACRDIIRKDIEDGDATGSD